MAILISHFYNEEYLLPYWLKHHKDMFEHGILIDYDSTDRSNDIIREIVPNWELRKSRNRDFDVRGNDDEVMDVERALGQVWKVCLTTTEFLMCANLDEYLKSKPKGIYIGEFTMIEPPETVGQDLDPNLPLVFQRHYGTPNFNYRRGRFMHRFSHGAYEEGRHKTHYLDLRKWPPESNKNILVYPDDIFLCWYGFSPWNENVKKRKLQIQPRRTERDIKQNRGTEHAWSSEQMDKKLEEFQLKAVNLVEYNENFRKIWKNKYSTLLKRI